MRQEIDRCKLAVSIALEGKTVALVSSGDSGIYGMTGILLEVIAAEQADVEVIAVPGVTAASAAAAILGAPLMHDFAVISLSDLMTPLSRMQLTALLFIVLPIRLLALSAMLEDPIRRHGSQRFPS